MTILDIAQAMRGKLRDGYSAPQAGGAALTSELSYGTAQADSAGGFVDILMDNMPAGGNPADYTFSVACDSPISNGDRVAYITIDGVGKAVSTATVANMAQNANAIASAMNQYFFHDSNGAHVATVPDDPDSGQNVTLNSYGLLFRDGATDAASFTPTAISLGLNCDINPSIGSEGTVALNLYNRVTLSLKRISWLPWYTGKIAPNGQNRLATVVDSVFQAASLIAGHINCATATFSMIRADEYYDANGEKIAATQEVIYSSAAGKGANTTFGLYESAADYAYLDFIYTDGTRIYTERLYEPDGKSFSLFRSVVGSGVVYNAVLMGSVSGSTVTLGAESDSTMSGNAITTAAGTTLKVIEVKGGK